MEDLKNSLISVIVPVYNVEHFLEECIVSILNQTIHDLQIILINDGSTDASGQICDQLAVKDKRITVIHQKNVGVSAARNVGLRVAKGKYIAFVDSDDVLPVDAYENLLNCVEEKCLAMGCVQLISEKGELMRSSGFGVENISQEEFLTDLFQEKCFPYLGYLGDKLFCRELIEVNKIHFDETIKLNEDRMFVLTYIFYCEVISFNEHVVYYYRQRSSGVISETRRNATVTDSEMTVLDSFGKMQKICRGHSEELYYTCSRKAFESALDLLNRVDKDDIAKKEILKRFLLENSYICLRNPEYSFLEKIKIVGHTVLKK